jgi:ubiquinone/menaquinone biosynthesis C-methylase UbiE
LRDSNRDLILLQNMTGGIWHMSEGIEPDITRTDINAANYLWYAERRNRRAYYQEFAASMPKHNQRVLDVGCGDGILTLQAAERGTFAVGLDLSATMIAFARRRQIESGRTNVAWVVASADAPPFCDQSFDCIVSCMALHLSRLESSLPSLRRLAAPGGRIIINDNVSSPLRFGFWLTYIWKTARRAPSFLHFFGWRGTWRMIIYRFSPPAIRQMRLNWKNSPALFLETYARYFPESDQRLELVPGRLVWENKPKPS